MISESEKERLFEQILAENKRRLHLFAQANARGDSARDLEQEILLQIWRSIDLYEGRSNLKTWFYGIAYNTLRDFKRTNRRPEVAIGSVPAAAIASASGPPERIERLHVIDEFMRSIEDVDRALLVMYLDGCSYQEISEATAVEEGTLRVRIHRLKKELAKFAES